MGLYGYSEDMFQIKIDYRLFFDGKRTIVEWKSETLDSDMAVGRAAGFTVIILVIIFGWPELFCWFN